MIGLLSPLLYKTLKRTEKLTLTAERQLYDAWKRGSIPARNAILQAYLPWAVKIARRYQRHADHFDDLVHVAFLALIKSLNSKSYNPHRTPLYNTSYRRIDKALHNHVTSYATIISVPPAADAKRRVGRYTKQRDQARSTLLSIHADHTRHDHPIDTRYNGIQAIDNEDEQRHLRSILANLPRLQAKILYALYYLNESLDATANRLKTTRHFVTATRNAALDALRTTLTAKTPN
jgi:RNA polymerase sigma factor (sigma-70 family)